MRAKTAMLAAALAVVASEAAAYPEFQTYSQKNSGMGVSCAMCHVHPDGPEGAAHGQIGALDPEAMKLLNEARGAFEPGKKVHSPILNEFGNSMVGQLGKKKILELKRKPEALSAALDPKNDLDADGVPDAREYQEGTHPLHKTSGNPALLFLHNFKRHLFPIIMVTLATLCLLYGFRNLHLALERKAGLTAGEDDSEPDDSREDEIPAHIIPCPTAAQLKIQPVVQRTAARPADS